MKKYLTLIIPIILFSCQVKKSNKESNNAVFEKQTETEQIHSYFNGLEKVLQKDNGQFWNAPLYGPILIVNPNDRTFFANQNNISQSFRKTGNIYTDTLPPEINIANTATDWDGIRWTMVMAPLPEEEQSRNKLLIHELFHRIQPAIGFDDFQEYSNAHLDTQSGRVFLKLELEALKKAVVAKRGDDQNKHLKNALIFRQLRYTNEEIKTGENLLELNEGLAEYTGLMLSGFSEQELISHFKESINTFYDNPTFVRSFAYQTIPIYGYLLSLKDNHWHQQITKETNLADYFAKANNITLPTHLENHQLAIRDQYNFANIVAQEAIREKEKLAQLAEYKLIFLKKPTLKLSFENFNISFDPRNIVPLEEYGTVYPNLRITDNWGILTVENGALLSSDWSHVTVSAPTKIADTLVAGNGWELALNKNWRIEKQDEKYALIK